MFVLHQPIAVVDVHAVDLVIDVDVLGKDAKRSEESVMRGIEHVVIVVVAADLNVGRTERTGRRAVMTRKRTKRRQGKGALVIGVIETNQMVKMVF